MTVGSVRAIVLVSAVAGVFALAPASAAAPIPYNESAFYWGSPFPQGEDVRWVDFAGEEGYLVSGTTPPDEDEEDTPLSLLRTSDGGRTWEQLGGAPARIDRVHALGDGKAVIEACDVLRTDDGGRTFQRLPLQTAPDRCARGASFPSQARGYFLGRDGGVSTTDDGGRTLSARQRLPGVTDQTDTARLFFSSPETGVGIRDGAIYRTDDGARSWTQVAAAARPLRDVELSGASGYAVGDASTVLSTTDGGLTWRSQALRGIAQQSLAAVKCVNPSTCLFVNDRAVFSAEPALLRTTDGGRTANVVDGTEAVSTIDVPGPNQVVAAGGAGRIDRSSDAGRSFERLAPPVPSFQLIVAPDATLHSFDSKGTLGRSVNGGRAWTQVRLPVTEREFVGAPSFSSRSRGAVVVTGPRRRGRPTRMRLLTTRDGGTSWVTARRDRVSRISAVLALSGGRLLATGKAGVTRSANGGRHFRRVRSPAFRGQRVHDFDRAGSAVVAIGDSRWIAISRDLGRTWRRRSLPRGISFADIDFATGRVGFVTGEGRLYRTDDGGRSWKRQFSIGARKANEVSFSDPNHGFVDVSLPETSSCMDCYDFGSASVMRTDDGGKTWTPQFLLDGDQIDELVAVGRRRGVVSLADGLIWTTAAGRGPTRERLRAALNRRRLARPGRVTVSGSIRPTGRRSLSLSRMARDGSTRTGSIKVTPGGRFRLTTKVFRTTRFVVHAGSDSLRSGAGSEVLRVVVRRR